MHHDFVKHALSYGKEGQEWLRRTAEMVKAYEHKWSLRVEAPYELSYNYVAPATRRDGKKVVLKFGFPFDKEFQSEIAALLFFNGDGCVKLIEIDKEHSVILIEQASPGIPLSTIQDDHEATILLASIMKKLHKPLPRDHSYITVERWLKALHEYPKQVKDNPNPPIPMNMVDKAIGLFRELIATSEPAVLTHADLHHDNVLTSDRDGWIAIDPKGIAAEPAYETAAMIRNPYALLKDMRVIDELLIRRIRCLSEELAIDPNRIHKWCYAQTVLFGVWTCEDQGDTAHTLRVAQALDRLKV